jgi:hypothetical protein
LEISHAQARDIVRGLGGGVLSTEVMQSVVQIVTQKQKESVSLERHEHWKNEGGEEETNHDMLLEEAVKPKILYLDLVQMVSIILIPTLTKFAKEWKTRNFIQSELLQGKYPSEMERLQGRLQKLRKKNPIEFASVEVGLSEASFGQKGNIDIESAAFEEENKSDPSLDSLSPKPDGLLEFVLSCICSSLRAQRQASLGADMENDRGPPEVTTDLVKSLLVMNGEFERADDSVLVQRMVDAAQSPSGCLDESAFVNALTSDLGAWDVGCEDKMSTSLYDVFGTHHLKSFQRVDRGNQVESFREPLGFNHEQNDTDKKKISSNEDMVKKGTGEKGADTKDTVEATYSGGKSGKSNEDPGENTGNIVDVHAGETEIIRAGSSEKQPTSSSQGIDQVEPEDSPENMEKKNTEEEGTNGKDEKIGEDGVKDIVGSAVPGGKSVTIDKDDKGDVAENTVKLLETNSIRIIDTVLDSYGSSAALLLIWFTYISQSATYASLILSTDAFSYECIDTTFGCTLVKTIINW